MKSILTFEPIICPATVSVIVVRCEADRTDIYVQLAGTRNNFELLRSAMDGHYEEQGLGEGVTAFECGGVYAVRDNDGHWYRAIVKVGFHQNLAWLLHVCYSFINQCLSVLPRLQLSQ